MGYVIPAIFDGWCKVKTGIWSMNADHGDVVGGGHER